MPGKPMTADDIYNEDLNAMYGVAEPAEPEMQDPEPEEAPQGEDSK